MVVQSRRGGAFGSMTVDTDRTEVRFNEFYLALSRWLDHQKSKKVQRRCTLVRYNTGSLSAISGTLSAMSGTVTVGGGCNLPLLETSLVEVSKETIAEEGKDDASSASLGSDDDGLGSVFEDGQAD